MASGVLPDSKRAIVVDALDSVNSHATDVLLVESDDLIRFALRWLLSSDRRECVAVASAEVAQQLLAAGPCCLQLRAKTVGARVCAASARRLLPLCRAAEIPFCVNDRLDVALAVGAEVAHLGQDDLVAFPQRQAEGRG